MTTLNLLRASVEPSTKAILQVRWILQCLAILDRNLSTILPLFPHSIHRQVSFREELMTELRFVAKCSGNTKPVRHRKSSSGSRNSLESGLSEQQSADGSKMDLSGPVGASGGGAQQATSNGKSSLNVQLKSNGRKMVMDD